MEDYQSENDYVNIREWAQQIREQKIAELRNKIDFKQEIANHITDISNIHVVQRKMELIDEVCKLKDKLLIITA
jgi:hypothetical protein